MKLSLYRQALTLTLVFSVSYFGFGFACNKSQRDKDLVWARDIATAFHTAEPYVSNLAPSIVANYHKGVGVADQVIDSIAASDAQTTAQLLADLIPIFNEVTAALNGNTAALSILALADIGIHVLLNHLPTNTTKIKPARAGSTDAASVLLDFKNQQIWGCAYRPEKCKWN